MDQKDYSGDGYDKRDFGFDKKEWSKKDYSGFGYDKKMHITTFVLAFIMATRGILDLTRKTTVVMAMTRVMAIQTGLIEKQQTQYSIIHVQTTCGKQIF